MRRERAMGPADMRAARSGQGRRVAPAALVAGVALGAGVVMAARRFAPRPVRTAGGWAWVRSLRAPDGSLIRVLSQGGVYQSATYLDERRFDPVFAYQRAFDAAFAVDDALRARRGRGVEHVLAIGGGGFAWPKHVAVRRPRVRVEVAEIDPAIIRAARTWFFLDEAEELAAGRLQVRCEDGRALLERAGARYDAIVNDAFSGAEPAWALATVEAARAARARLTPGGLYLANVVSRAGGGDLAFLRDTVATLATVFTHVHVIPASDDAFGGEENYLVIATDGDASFPEAIPFDRSFLGVPLRDDATLGARPRRP